MNRITTGVIVSLLILAAALGWTTSHYHGNAVKYKDQRDTVTHNLKMANETISDMQTRQRDVAALDAKYTKELADAQNRNTDLQRRLAAGSRVRVEGSCTVPTTTKTASTGKSKILSLMVMEDEKAHLDEWKKYRVLVNRVDTSNPDWPEMSAN